VAGAIDDDPRIDGEQPVRPDAATLVQPASYEVGRVEPDGVSVFPRLAGGLSEDQIVTLECCENQRPAALGLTQVRKRKVEDRDITLYKLAQAASSSGASQSLAKAVSAASVGTDASAWSSARVRKNANSRSRSGSESRVISWAMSSRLVMTHLTTYSIEAVLKSDRFRRTRANRIGRRR
jgi:hypothetical protein